MSKTQLPMSQPVLKFFDEVSSGLRRLRFADPDDVAVVEGAELLARGRQVRFTFTLVNRQIVDIKAIDAGPLPPIEWKIWVRGVLSSREDEVCEQMLKEGWVEDSRDERHIRFVRSQGHASRK